MPKSAAIRFEHHSPIVRFGDGAVAGLAEELATHGLDRAVVVCGESIEETAAVIDPVLDGLGDRVVSVVAEAGAEKRVSMAATVAEHLREADAEVIVGLGAGSSLDIAKVAAVLYANGMDGRSGAAELVEHGRIRLGPEAPLPIVTIPTTLAGAELSHGAGITVDPTTDPVETSVKGGVADRRLTPRVVIYDPRLVAETPRAVLAGSAMNGFDKGLEAIYAPKATPITDATSARGLSILVSALPTLADTGRSIDLVGRILEGTWLVQYGTSRPDATTLSLIHAFGHGLTAVTDVQQGVAHAIMVEPVLRYIFDRVDGRRELLARALEVDGDSPDALADGIIERVCTVRDALGLPTSLRTINGLEPGMLDEVARITAADRLVENVPDGLQPTHATLVDLLETAW